MMCFDRRELAGEGDKFKSPALLIPVASVVELLSKLLK